MNTSSDWSCAITMCKIFVIRKVCLSWRPCPEAPSALKGKRKSLFNRKVEQCELMLTCLSEGMHVGLSLVKSAIGLCIACMPAVIFGVLTFCPPIIVLYDHKILQSWICSKYQILDLPMNMTLKTLAPPHVTHKTKQKWTTDLKCKVKVRLDIFHKDLPPELEEVGSMVSLIVDYDFSTTCVIGILPRLLWSNEVQHFCILTISET